MEMGTQTSARCFTYVFLSRHNDSICRKHQVKKSKIRRLSFFFQLRPRKQMSLNSEQGWVGLEIMVELRKQDASNTWSFLVMIRSTKTRKHDVFNDAVKTRPFMKFHWWLLTNQQGCLFNYPAFVWYAPDCADQPIIFFFYWRAETRLFYLISVRMGSRYSSDVLLTSKLY